MAQSKSLADNLEKHLECAICLEQYKEPKVLPCLHTFCGACLKGLLTKQEAIWKVACPTCRTNAEIADGKIDSLPVNFFVNNLLSLLSLHGSSDAGVLECDNCEGGDPPTSRCTVCSYFLCDFCSQAHQRGRSTKSHCLMSLQEAKEMGVSAVMKPSFCKAHDGEMVKLFCETCDQAICRDCTIINHRDHDYLFLKDAFPKAKREIQLILQETKNKLPILEQGLNGISQVKKSIQLCAEEVEKGVTDCFHELMSALEIRRLDLTSTAEDHYKSKVKALEIQEQDLEIALGSVKSSIEFAEKAFESGNQIDALNLKKQIGSRLQALNLTRWKVEPCVIDTFEFQSDHGELQREIATFGAVMDTATCPSTTTVTMGHGPEGVMYNCLYGQPLEFTIFARERGGKKRRNGGDVFNVDIMEPDIKPSIRTKKKASKRKVRGLVGQGIATFYKVLNVRDCGNGTYTFSYTPQKAGNYCLSVQLHGHHVQGSPFSWKVHSWVLDLCAQSSSCVRISLSADSRLALLQMGTSRYSYLDPYQQGLMEIGTQAIISGSEGFKVGKHSWKVRLSFDSPLLAFGVCDLTYLKSLQFSWTLDADGMYDSPTANKQSVITKCAKNDVIEMFLDCDNKVLLMFNQRTKQCDTWEDIYADGPICPVFFLEQNGDEISLNL